MAVVLIVLVLFWLVVVVLGCCPALPSWCCIGFSTDLFKVGGLVYRCPQLMSYHGYDFGDGTQKVGLHQRSVGACYFLSLYSRTHLDRPLGWNPIACLPEKLQICYSELQICYSEFSLSEVSFCSVHPLFPRWFLRGSV